MNIDKWLLVLVVIVCVVVGIIIGYFLYYLIRHAQFKLFKNKIKALKYESQNIINEAKTEAQAIIIEMQTVEGLAIANQKQNLASQAKFLAQKQKDLEEEQTRIARQKEEANQISAEANEIYKKYSQNLNKAKVRLERIVRLSPSEAKTELFNNIKIESAHEFNDYVKKKLFEAKAHVKQKASTILLQAMERMASDVVIENTTNRVELSNESIKGRIIGKEGRNIKAFEHYIGVEIIVDDTPNMVMVSCFNPIRREIATIALKRLIEDGRIQPIRIEEMIDVVEKEINEIIIQQGEDVVSMFNLYNIHPDIIEHIGRLKYRTSYSQNVLKHSIEVANISGAIAGELGLNIKIAQRAGLLHDVGKASDFEEEGSHVTLGVNLAKRCKESEIIINAIEAHHEDVPKNNPYAFIVSVADTLSAARPGARNNVWEKYITRLTNLEDLCNAVEGVEKTFVVKTGRDIRVMVNPDKINDDQAELIALTLKNKIRINRNIPGDITITVIREKRFIENII